MYAARRISVTNFDSTPAEERYSVRIARGGTPVRGIQSKRINLVQEEVMYWRKANHIHAWFVDNVQDGQDDCRSYYVSDDDLRQLLSACEAVIKASKLVDGTVYAGTVYNKDHPGGVAQREPGKVIEDATVAKQLLPTRSGCFFGSVEYDADYLSEVVGTRDWIERMLADRSKKGTPGDIYYTSSW